MSHKYYGFQKQEENLYTLPFLSTKTQRLRFLNDDFIGYGEKNQLIIHKKPGLTIVRLDDQLINNRYQNQSNTQKLMNELLNQLLNNSQNSGNKDKIRYSSKAINIKQIAVSSNSSIRITINSL